MELLIFLFVVYLIIYTHRVNNDVYEYFYPDERQYVLCGNEGGETNISMKEIKPSPPLKGFFSSLLKNTEEKSSDKHFGIHMCIPRQAVEKEVEYIYDHNIIDHEENEKDSTSFDTYNYHYSPVDKNYFVTYEVTQTEYDDAFNQQFLENRDKIFNTDDRF